MNTTLARFDKTHAEVKAGTYRFKNDLLNATAGFTWNPSTKAYEITVENHIVAQCRTIAEVEAFSDMHNAGVFDGGRDLLLRMKERAA